MIDKSPRMPAPQASTPFLGVILLDTHFMRPPGDIGQADTFRRAGIPARFWRVPTATAQRVVQQADPDLLEPFVQAAQALEEAGAALITTSCGFLARYQDRLQAAVRVPLISSSLLLCRTLPSVGIVTFDAASLGADVLAGAQVPAHTPVQGLAPGCALQVAILQDHPAMDLAQTRDDVVQAALRLQQGHPQLQHIVLECTNMPPYRDAVAQATGCQVHDLETLLLDQWPRITAR